MKRVTDFFAVAPKKQALESAVNKIKTPSPSDVSTKDDSLSSSTSNKESESNKSDLSKTSDWDKEKWVQSLDPETKELLTLEIDTLGSSWLEHLHQEITKPYFIKLKQFLKSQKEKKVQIFPPEKDIYSWSRLSAFSNVRVVILGQDPYHNVGQAHGLAFSVNPPTPPPPSLVNIYKELKSCYPETFIIPKHGSLLKWANQGVLMLNACLTVEAHRPNSHANKGWEQFTEQVIKIILKNNKHVVLMAWGSPAGKRINQIQPGQQHLVLRSVHPSPLSASRGWFGTQHFIKANEWLQTKDLEPIDWHLLPKPKQKQLTPPKPDESSNTESEQEKK